MRERENEKAPGVGSCSTSGQKHSRGTRCEKLALHVHMRNPTCLLSMRERVAFTRTRSQ